MLYEQYVLMLVSVMAALSYREYNSLAQPGCRVRGHLGALRQVACLPASGTSDVLLILVAQESPYVRKVGGGLLDTVSAWNISA